MNTYLIYDKGSNLIKIGRAIDVKSRQASLQIGCGSILELLHTFPLDIELVLHNRLKSKRVQGEWFNTTVDEVLEVIKGDKFLNELVNGDIRPQPIELSVAAGYALNKAKWIKKLEVNESKLAPMNVNVNYLEKMCIEYGLQSGKRFQFIQKTGYIKRVR